MLYHPSPDFSTNEVRIRRFLLMLTWIYACWQLPEQAHVRLVAMLACALMIYIGLQLAWYAGRRPFSPRQPAG